MVLALLASLFSVALGAAIAFWGTDRRTALSAVRTFALVSVAAVVLTHILPASLEELGLLGAGIFVAAIVVPAAIEWITHRGHDHVHHSHGVGVVEVGYVGLLIHQFVDGLGLGAYGSGLIGADIRLQVIVALAAHTIPVTALFVLAFSARRGMRAALVGAAGLCIATCIGIGVAGLVSPAVIAPYEAWVSAIVAGFLIHVVTHGWEADPRPTMASRWLDLAAITAGIGLTFLGSHAHHDAGGIGGGVRREIGEAFVDLTFETAPTLLLGLVLGAILQVTGSHIPSRWLSAGGSWNQAIRGALFGIPLPVCACGILPVADAIRARGAGIALVVAFMLATPELGADTFALTVRFLGWPFAFVRLLAALAVAIVAAVVISRVAKDTVETTPSSCATSSSPFGEGEASKPLAVRLLAHFDELLHHTGAWTLMGLAMAAFIQVILPPSSLVGLSNVGLDVVVISLVAVPSYVCASSATPLAAVLLLKGVSPGAVLAGLLLGPATNVATIAFFRRSFGKKAAFYGVLALLVTTWVIAYSVNALELPISAVNPTNQHHTHGLFTIACAGLLSLLVLRSIWLSGLRAWLGSLNTLSVTENDTAHATMSAHHSH